MRKTEDNLEKDIITGTIPGNRRSGRPPRDHAPGLTTLQTRQTCQRIRYCRWSGIENTADTIHRATKVRTDE